MDELPSALFFPILQLKLQSYTWASTDWFSRTIPVQGHCQLRAPGGTSDVEIWSVCNSVSEDLLKFSYCYWLLFLHILKTTTIIGVIFYLSFTEKKMRLWYRYFQAWEFDSETCYTRAGFEPYCIFLIEKISSHSAIQEIISCRQKKIPF